jgi:hypothetical protein
VAAVVVIANRHRARPTIHGHRRRRGTFSRVGVCAGGCTMAFTLGWKFPIATERPHLAGCSRSRR